MIFVRKLSNVWMTWSCCRGPSTVQSQQNRVRSSAEEAMQATKTDVQVSAATKMDNQVTALALDNTDLKRKVQDIIQDNRLQFDNVSRVFKIFSDALNMAPPYFPSFQSPSTNLSSSSASNSGVHTIQQRHIVSQTLVLWHHREAHYRRQRH